jgi:hypothetical protein
MSILRVRDTKILNFKSARSLQSIFFVRSYGATLRIAAKAGGRWHIWQQRSLNISDLSQNVLYWSTDFTSDKLNEYTIIYRKVGDDHQS